MNTFETIKIQAM